MHSVHQANLLFFCNRFAGGDAAVRAPGDDKLMRVHTWRCCRCMELRNAVVIFLILAPTKRDLCEPGWDRLRQLSRSLPRWNSRAGQAYNVTVPTSVTHQRARKVSNESANVIIKIVPNVCSRGCGVCNVSVRGY